MKFLYSDETIIACSTSSLAHAALAVLRISGFKDLSQFSPFFSKNLAGPIEPRRVYYTKLQFQGTLIDDVCLTYFQGPQSYNAENILEISIHGNTLNIERILNLFVKEGGCRLAYPGEFTYRALKNKKLTLSQVEGLDLFLNANSGFALDQGLSLLAGNLHETYQELYDLFLKHKSSLELSIDFADDVGEETARKYFLDSLAEFKKKFESLYKRVMPLDHNIIQPEVLLAGLPNSGKSSLFNALLSEDRAIVSSKAGTTRDYLSEAIFIDGVKYKLIDTAGLRESSDEIEAEGIKRARKKIHQAFFSILLINPFEVDESLGDLLLEKFDLILFTHSDAPLFEETMLRLIKIYPVLGSIGAISIPKFSEAEQLTIYGLINNKYLHLISQNPIILDRHKSLISSTYSRLQSYSSIVSREPDVAIISHELNSLGHCISELLGIVSPDQILNSIFSNFCIGK
jgi:tRNA modification GTPase